MKIIPFKHFVKDVKKLKKKYKNILNDIELFQKEIKLNPTMGTSLGNGMFKIRVANSNKNQGKSGGYRIITFYTDNQGLLYLLRIYDKSEISTIKTSALIEIIKSELE